VLYRFSGLAEVDRSGFLDRSGLLAQGVAKAREPADLSSARSVSGLNGPATPQLELRPFLRRRRAWPTSPSPAGHVGPAGLEGHGVEGFLPAAGQKRPERPEGARHDL